jgi:hypothetical protein
MIHFKYATILLAIGCTLTGCGETTDETESNETSSQTETGAGTLNISPSELPNVTDPVVAFTDDTDSEAATAAANFNSLNISNSLRLNATTGVSLGNTYAEHNEAFQAASNPSPLFCEAVYEAHQRLFDAAGADSMKCFMTRTVGEEESLFDGEEHIITLKLTDDESGGEMEVPVKLKFDGPSDNLSGFTMWACQNNEQSHYTNISFNESSVSMKLIRKHEGGQECASWTDMTLDSDINSDKQLVGLKNVTVNFQSECSDGSTGRWGTKTITQSDKFVLFKGYNVEASQDNSQLQHVLLTEIFDNSDSLSDFALSDLSLGSGAGVHTNHNDTSSAQGWNGDTLNIEAQAESVIDMKEYVASISLPEVANTEVEVGFTGDQAWNCSGTPELESTVSSETAQYCDGRFMIDQEGQNLDCNSL